MRLTEFHSDGFRGVTVDRENHIIKGVKLLGFQSRNGRRYAESAVEKAAPLYEDVGVGLDHRRQGEPQSLVNRAGTVRGVKFRAGEGLFGDLHYLKGDAHGEKLASLAEQSPKSFGMSHDADGELNRVKGESVVEEITKVHSVDAVADPATTKNLSEQVMAKTTLRKLVEATDYKHAVKLLEMAPELLPDEEIAVEEEGESAPDPIDAVADALAVKVADAIKDPNKTDAEVGQMAKAASKTVASVRSDMEPAAEPESEEGDGENGEENDPPVQESADAKYVKRLEGNIEKLTESITGFAKRDAARTVLEAVGATVNDALLSELTECKDRDAMESLVETWSPQKLGRSKPAIGSRQTTNLPESADDYASRVDGYRRGH